MKKPEHVILTSHSNQIYNKKVPLVWGAHTAEKRGPIIASQTPERNAIGSHSGSYAVYRALSVASGQFPRDYRPDLAFTNPTRPIGPFSSWSDPEAIVSIDPWGADITDSFPKQLARGTKIMPTIAITEANYRSLRFKKLSRMATWTSTGILSSTRPMSRCVRPPWNRCGTCLGLPNA